MVPQCHAREYAVQYAEDRDLNDKMDGKAEVVALLAPSCNPKTVQQAIATARHWHITFRSDLADHVDDHKERLAEEEELDDTADEGTADVDVGEVDLVTYDGDDDEDVQRFQDLAMMTAQMLHALESAQ